MALPDALVGDRWTEITARHILPLLVWCANHGEKISYGQLDAELQRRRWGHHVNVVMYGHPAGAVGNALLETEKKSGQKIPPLNALVINARTGIPGSGCDYYLSTYLGKRRRKQLSDDERKAMSEETMEEIWRFQGWDEILNDYGLNPIKGGIPSLQTTAVEKKPKKSGWLTGPESDAHKALKTWVAKHPKVIKSKIPFKTGAPEWLFASNDRVDVLFEHSDGCIAVEVKAAEAADAELERGIYQCVKYQALLRAELKAQGKIPNGLAILVIERHLPVILQQLADLLGVRVIRVQR